MDYLCAHCISPDLHFVNVSRGNLLGGLVSGGLFPLGNIGHVSGYSILYFRIPALEHPFVAGGVSALESRGLAASIYRIDLIIKNLLVIYTINTNNTLEKSSLFGINWKKNNLNLSVFLS